MNAATRNILILIAGSVFGLLLAMNLPQSTRANNDASAQGIAVNLTGANNVSDLVSSVDWSKIKQEPMAPTF